MMQTIFEYGVTEDELEKLGLAGTGSKEAYLKLLYEVYQPLPELQEAIRARAWLDRVRLARLRQDRALEAQLIESEPQYRGLLTFE